MVGTSRLFIGGLPISKDLSKNELQKIVSMYAKDVEIITDSEGYCKGFAYINVPNASAQACIAQLHGTTFMKGLLRVERAQESFIERLRREWGDAALEKQYQYPLSAVSKPFMLDTSSMAGGAKGKPTSANATPFVLDTSSTAGSAKGKATPTNGTTPTKPNESPNSIQNPNNTKITILGDQAAPTVKSTNSKNKKEENKARHAAKAALKAQRRMELVAARTADEKTPNKRKAEELENAAETPRNGQLINKSATPSNGNATPLDLMEEKPTTEETTGESQQNGEEQQQPRAKKQKRKPRKDTPAKPATPTTPTPPPSTPAPPKTPTTHTPAPKTAAAPKTPATPSIHYPETPSTSTPTTPTSSNSAVTLWDMGQVQQWATGIAGDELAEKLKTKGVKGRKLINWKDTFASNQSGLRKQITEFLQLPEHMESDADDLSMAILQLQ